jgi:hypothetical protein
MADYFLLGLFHEATPTADTIADLRDLGISDDKVTVMSGIPYRSDILGRRQVYERLVLIALIGALSGFIAAVFLMAGTPFLYPVHVGGQPLTHLLGNMCMTSALLKVISAFSSR